MPPKLSAKAEPSHLTKRIDAIEAPEVVKGEVLWRADFSTAEGRREVATPNTPSSRTQSRNCY
jgi:hypothetical protein